MPVDRVFLSYSRTPLDNVEFVRELKRQLELAGVDVWLDEEQLPAGSSVQDRILSAISSCGSGLLIITSDWIEKDWTRYEGDFLAKRGARLLMIHREPIDNERLGPFLHGLNFIAWPQDAADPAANLWQVYCGLKGVAPGPNRLWNQKGRELLEGRESRSNPPPVSAAPVVEEQPPQPIINVQTIKSGTHTPILSRATETELLLLMDDGQWLSIALKNLKIDRIPHLKSTVSDAVFDGNELVTAQYRPSLARLRAGAWETSSVESPVLRLKQTEFGIAVGDSAGRVSLLEVDGLHEVARLDSPIVDLHDCDNALVALMSTGRIARTIWPSDGSWEFLQTEELGRPVEFFSTGSGSRIGVMSQTRIGTFQATANWSLKVSPPIQEGIDVVVPFGQRGLFAAISDLGNLWMINLPTGSVQRLQLPDTRSQIVNATCGPQGRVFVWTATGDAFLVLPTGVIRNLDVSAVIWVHPGRETVALSFEQNKFTAKQLQI